MEYKTYLLALLALCMATASVAQNFEKGPGDGLSLAYASSFGTTGDYPEALEGAIALNLPGLEGPVSPVFADGKLETAPAIPVEDGLSAGAAFSCETGVSIVVVTPNPTFCPDEILELALSGSADPSQYYVHLQGYAVFVNSTPVNWSQTVQVQIIDGDFGLVAEPSDPSCPVIEQGFSFQEPTVSLTVPSYDNLLDVNEAISLTVNPDYNADVVLWDSPTGGSIIPILNDGTSVDITFGTSGNHMVTATPSNECGPGTTSEIPFTVELACETGVSIVVVTPNPTYCPEEILELQLSGSVDPSSYNVHIEGSAILSLPAPASWADKVEVQLGSSGSLYAIAERSDKFCAVFELYRPMSTLPSAIGEIEYENRICSGETTLMAITPGTYNATEIQWSATAGATVSNNNNTVDGSDITVAYSGPGDYSITATPVNACGAGSSKVFGVTVLDNSPAVPYLSFGKEGPSISSIVNDPQWLVVNACTEMLHGCEIFVQEVDLDIRFGILEGYSGLGSDWSAFADIQVRAVDRNGLALKDYENRIFRLQLDEDNPEAAFIDGFHTNPSEIFYFEVTVKDHFIPTQMLDRIGLVMSYERKVTHNMDKVSLNTLAGTQLNGWDAHFSWAVAEPCAGTIKDFQLQVIKVSDELAPVDWDQAVDIFIEGQDDYTLALGEGSGAYVWRVRPVDNHKNGMGNKLNYRDTWYNGNKIDFIHSEADYELVKTADNTDVNWIYSRTYTEGNRYSEQITYADGLQQVLQQQTRLNSMNHVVTTQTVQDHLGRNAVTSLPVPLAGNDIGYKKQLLTVDGTAEYEADNYKDRGKATGAKTLNNYYSESSLADNVPDDGGYPFTRTIYTTDGTNRVREQTGVGELHHRSDRTVKYYYGSVAQDELDNLFGPEAPEASNVQKTAVVDANGVASVTYTDKAGKTIATALTGEGNSAGLETLPSGMAPVVEEITDGQQVSKFKRLLSKQIVFPTGGTLDRIEYFLQPVKASLGCNGVDANGAPVVYDGLYDLCFSCDYRITLTAYHQESDSLRTLYEHVVTGDKLLDCNTATIPSIQQTLTAENFAAGTWVIEVTLEAYTGDGDGKFVDRNWEEVETAIRADYEAALAGIYADLENRDYEAVYQLLDSSGITPYYIDEAQSIGYYRLNVGDGGCEEYIEIPYYEEPCGYDCSDPLAFRSYFENYNYENHPEIPLTELGDLLYMPGFTATDLDNMFTNMLNEANSNTLLDSLGNVIGCDAVWEAWIAETHAYGDMYALEAEATAAGYRIPKLIDRFLDHLGILRTISSTVNNADYYKYFLYDQYDENQCNCMKIALETTSCDVLSIFDNYPNRKKIEALACLNALSDVPLNYSNETGTHTLDNCLVPSSTYLLAQERASEMEQAAKVLCENRYAEFEEDIQAYYTSLTEAELAAMAQSMVEACKAEISITVVADANCDISVGSAEEIEKIKKLILHDYSVTACGGANFMMPVDTTCAGQVETIVALDSNFHVTDWSKTENAQTLDATMVGKIFKYDGFIYSVHTDKILKIDDGTGSMQVYIMPDLVEMSNGLPVVTMDETGNLYFVTKHFSSITSTYQYMNSVDKDLNLLGSTAIAVNNTMPSVMVDKDYLYTYRINSSNEYFFEKRYKSDYSLVESPLSFENGFKMLLHDNHFYLFSQEKISKYQNGTVISKVWERTVSNDYSKIIDDKLYLLDVTSNGYSLIEMDINGNVLHQQHFNVSTGLKNEWFVKENFMYILHQDKSMKVLSLESDSLVMDIPDWLEYQSPNNALIVDNKFYISNSSYEFGLRYHATKKNIPDPGHREFCYYICDDFPDSVAVDTLGFSHSFALQSCEQVRSEHMVNTIGQQVEKLVEKKRQSFYEAYESTCMENIDHKLTLEYNLGYNQYTLYYYDRAGNLMKTVSPEGVKVDGSNVHDLVTKYEYNSLGQLTRQHSPDANSTTFNVAGDATDKGDGYFADFYYSDLGQLRFSQNAQQKVNATYSYTRYDKLGRITEVGEAAGFDVNIISSNRNNMGYPSGGKDITKTAYSAPFAVEIAWLNNQKQENLRNRISYTHTEDNDSDITNDTYTIYSYDPHGNVKWMVQKLPYLEKTFRIDYEYDLISGNVTQVIYNAYISTTANVQSEDEFRHKYEYDADNRLMKVETSTDGHLWSTEAQYQYYPHGPLKNVILGKDPVHNSEYYYTLHGWIKGINLDRRIKEEGQVAAVYSTILNYYTGDYTNTAVNNALTAQAGAPAAFVATNSTNLYNGNISGIEDYFSGAGDASNSGRTFKYDELNRIMSSQFDISAFGGGALAGNTGYIYDRNGNLKNLERNVNNVALDNIAYTYESNRNRLASVADAGTDANDLTNAYTYDEIGNLVSDNADNKTIAWNVYGKVKAVTDNATTQKTEFYYDPSGNRVLKKQVNEVGLVTGTYYVRDASGNVMATYEQIGEGIERELRLEEQPIYGSDRLGMFKSYKLITYLGMVGEEAGTGYEIVSQDKVVNLYDNKSYLLEEGVTLTLGSGFSVNAAAGETFEARPRQYEEKTLTNEEAMPLAHDEVHNRPLGYKQYELKDHLGNVRAVISDRRTLEQGADELGNPISYYQGELMTYNHYYPFGMDMASWSSDNFSSYRYGFNGKEKDNKGEFGSQTTYDYGFRIYNPGIGKFLSVDPLLKSYPWYTPYQFSGNKPIRFIDLDGLEEADPMENAALATGTAVLTKETVGTMTFKEARNFVGKTATGGAKFVGGIIFGTVLFVFTPVNNGESAHLAVKDEYDKERFRELASRAYESLSPDERVQLENYYSIFRFDDEGNVVINPNINIEIKNPNGVYNDESYTKHRKAAYGNVAAAPENGQKALDNSYLVVQKREGHSRRIGIEGDHFVILDEHTQGEFHGHQRTWDELDQDHKNVLIREGLVNEKGKILKK